MMPKQAQNRPSIFGRWTSKLLEMIKNNRRFQSQPIGPLGAYINLKPNLPKELAMLVEGELGQLVYQFLVQSVEDEEELNFMFDRLRLPFKPKVVKYVFSTEKDDISESKVDCENHLPLIEYFEIDDPTVYNFVLDSVGADRILIIAEDNDAQNLLKNQSTVPSNLIYAMTGAGYQYYPAPNFRSYHKDQNARGVLKSSKGHNPGGTGLLPLQYGWSCMLDKTTKEFEWSPEHPSDAKDDDDMEDPTPKPGHRLLIKNAILMPEAKKDEVTVLQIECDGYNKKKVTVPFVAMKGGVDHQRYIDLLVPCPAKITLLSGEGPIHLLGHHCVDF